MQQCFKREVCAIIVDEHGEIAVGQNLILNNDITECPRVKGEGYDKCITVCNQPGHAETEAISAAKSRGMTLKGATLYLIGHYRVCSDCQRECDEAGLNIVIVTKENK